MRNRNQPRTALPANATARKLNQHDSELLPSAEDLDEVFTRVAKGELLESVCKDEHLPDVDNVYRSLIQDPECFERFIAAQRVRTLSDVVHLQSIADGQERVLVREEHSIDPDTGTPVTSQFYAQEDVQRSRLRVDTIKWRAERLFPMIYGNRVAHDHNVYGELAEMMAAASNRGHLLPSELAKD